MKVADFKLHRRALITYHQLTGEEQARVRETLETLAAIPTADWPKATTRKLPGDEPLYLVSVDDSLRLFVRASNSPPPEVEDIVRQERLDFFAAAAAKNGH
jgi:hypothetical protein